jgi:hypothetical protein
MNYLKTISIFLFISTLLHSNIFSQNPIIRKVFTADPAPIVYNDTVFLYTSHDIATVDDTNYKMPNWLIFSSTDLVSWTNHGVCLSPKSFSWDTVLDCSITQQKQQVDMSILIISESPIN